MLRTVVNNTKASKFVKKWHRYVEKEKNNKNKYCLLNKTEKNISKIKSKHTKTEHFENAVMTNKIDRKGIENCKKKPVHSGSFAN